MFGSANLSNPLMLARESRRVVLVVVVVGDFPLGELAEQVPQLVGLGLAPVQLVASEEVRWVVLGQLRVPTCKVVLQQ